LHGQPAKLTQQKPTPDRHQDCLADPNCINGAPVFIADDVPPRICSAVERVCTTRLAPERSFTMPSTMLRVSLAAILSVTFSMIALDALAEGSPQTEQSDPIEPTSQSGSHDQQAISATQSANDLSQQRIAAHESSSRAAERRNREIVESVTGNLHPLSTY
jgi:hypothetical protein